MHRQLKIVGIMLLLLLSFTAASALKVDVLATDPAPLKAGEFADVTIQIASDSTESTYTNLQVSLKDTAFIRTVSADDLSFATFNPGRTITRTFRVFISEDLPSGNIDLEFILNSDQGTFEIDSRVFVESSDSAPELHIGQITTTPRELLPDTDDNRLTITLQNLGDKDAQLVQATLKTDDALIRPSYSFSMADSVAGIASGEQQELEFTIDIDKDASGQIPAQLELRYRTEESGQYRTYTNTIPFAIELIDAPLLVITAVDQLDSFVGGTTENEVRVTITNQGSEDAQEVRVRVLPDVSYPFVFETTTQYVASRIPPNGSAVVAFKAEVRDDALDANYTITTKLESLVGEARYAREDVLNLQTISGQKTAAGTVGMVVILLVVLLAAIIGVRTYGARKKERSSVGVRKQK